MAPRVDAEKVIGLGDVPGDLGSGAPSLADPHPLMLAGR